MRSRPIEMMKRLLNPPYATGLELLPAVLLTLSIGGNLVFQIIGLEAAWSPFSVLGVDFDVALIPLVLMALFGFWLGVVACAICTAGSTSSPTHSLVRVERLDRMSALLTIALVVALVVTQWSLGGANVVNLWRGMVTPKDVEEAIQASPMGVHGISLLVAYAAVMVWHAARLSGHSSPWVVLCFILSAIFFLSQGKAQGLMYLAAAYLLEPRRPRELVARVLFAILAISLIFLATRVARNQDGDLSLNFETLLLLALGLYFGSPLVNTSYILHNGLQVGNASAFVSHLIPEKLLARSDLFEQLPDPTSPLGLVGAGLVLGGGLQMLVFCVVVGGFTFYLGRLLRVSAAVRLFFPFLVVACMFSMMYNHFANLTFFWIPLGMAKFIADRLFESRISAVEV